MNTLSETLITHAAHHLQDILTLAIQHSPQHTALIIYDTQCPLAMTLKTAYQRILPSAIYKDFETLSAKEILAAFKQLAPSDLVILIQSTSFRLNDFRIRVELFEQGLKVIEHPHLSRMIGVECEYYIDALAYDPAYFRNTGWALKKRID